ncbi:hypothetical protein HHL17_22925 [Chitinophaga sp. G-6-1-13]|uniref:Uncharacterized protein n=1 Tax=Chitinophaga fulva TaxID=2728842 RepID=A0A848GSH8_9BACT|nr:hypothetical protein [Chitinophaga fulva]NML40072.1 hypothetical protein [Chitinophaga fulva]
MKKIRLFVSLVAISAFATTGFTFGTNNDAISPNNSHGQAATRLTTTYYPSKWNGVAIDPADAPNMYAYTYLINYSAGTATLMSGPNYSMLALTATCRNTWLNSNIDPSCTSGCRTWSYYYSAAPSFTSKNNYLVFGCSEIIDFK